MFGHLDGDGDRLVGVAPAQLDDAEHGQPVRPAPVVGGIVPGRRGVLPGRRHLAEAQQSLGHLNVDQAGPRIAGLVGFEEGRGL
jgi:hypothetical protein